MMTMTIQHQRETESQNYTDVEFSQVPRAATRMFIHDYNGTGEWSADRIQQRYAEYAAQLNVPAPRDLSPRTSEEGSHRWIFPVMDNVIDGIEADDPACVAIGIEFIEQDGGFTHGSILKSNTARALRRATLTDEQKRRIRTRVTDMLLADYTPHEYREYAKLLRRIGVAEAWPRIENNANLDHPYTAKYYAYFKEALRKEKAATREAS